MAIMDLFFPPRPAGRPTPAAPATPATPKARTGAKGTPTPRQRLFGRP